MRFDCVVGNPPYQSSSGDANRTVRPVWPKFISLAVSVTADNGTIAMVSPSSWIGKPSNRSNNYDVFSLNQIEYLETFDFASSPFSQGTSVCWYVMKKTKPNNPTTVVSNLNGRKHSAILIPLHEGTSLPSILTPTSISLNKKLLKGPRMEFVQTYEFHTDKMSKRNLTSDSKTKQFPYKYYVSHKIVRYSSIPFSAIHNWKVMVPSSSTLKNTIVDNNCGHAHDMYCVYTTSEQAASNVKTILTSKLFQYIGKAYRDGPNLTSVFRRKLFPAVDLTRPWTDEELYKHFNLTKEEIKLIEGTIK